MFFNLYCFFNYFKEDLRGKNKRPTTGRAHAKVKFWKSKTRVRYKLIKNLQGSQSASQKDRPRAAHERKTRVHVK